MADTAPVREKINTWAQVVALALAGVWAVYTFVYKEIIVPAGEPPFISADVDVTHMGFKDSLEVLQLRFTVTNQGKRPIHTLTSAATVWASRVEQSSAGLPAFLSTINEQLERYPYGNTAYVRFAEFRNTEMVAFYQLFSGYEFLPDGTGASEWLLYIPRGKYDQVEVDVRYPVVSDTSDFRARWTLHGDSVAVQLLHGGRFVDPARRRDAQELDRRNFAEIDSYATFSLWRRDEEATVERVRAGQPGAGMP